MTQEMLALFATAALRDSPGNQWDSLGWNIYSLMSSGSEATKEQLLTEWKNRIDDHHKRWTRKYRDYAKAGGLHANFSGEEEKQREDATYASDMADWENVRLKKIERVDGVLKFYTESNETFEMDAEELFSQVIFRKKFMRGTNIILPPIKQKSYERFYMSWQITKVENIGISLLEKIEEALEAQQKQFDEENPLKDEAEAIDVVSSRSVAVLDNWIYFKISWLIQELKRMDEMVKPSQLVITLRDIGAEHIKSKKFNLWKYNLGTVNV